MYGTSVKAVREPSQAGKVVLLDTQLKAVNLLQSFADIHPIVIFIKPTSAESLAAILQEPLSPEALQKTFNALSNQSRDNEHIFTHVVEVTGSFDETVQTLANTYAAAASSDYWVNTFHSLPLNTPEGIAAEVATDSIATSEGVVNQEVGKQTPQVVCQHLNMSLTKMFITIRYIRQHKRQSLRRPKRHC